jgi:hypothetical protein
MQIRVFAAAAVVILALVGCADSTPPTAPPPGFSPSRAATAASTPVETSGTFDAIVDFSTVTLTPKGENCLLTVHGRLVFHGTIEGTANGVTSALEFAPCSDVAVNPPGTFPDVFKSVATFDGFINGQHAQSNLLYAGRVAVGGAIDGRLIFSDGVSGALDANAIVAVGGTYSGSLVVH